MALPGQTTLATVRTTVRQRCDQVNSQFVTDAELNSWINANYQELYGNIVEHFGNDYSTNGSSPYQFTTDGVNQFFNLPDGSTTYKNPDGSTAAAILNVLAVRSEKPSEAAAR